MGCLKVLREKGYRITPQRGFISRIIHEAKGHIAAEEIYRRIKEEHTGVFSSTIYRNLKLMEKLGLVAKIDIGDGIYRYHLAEKRHHHHLICQSCGKVFDLDEEALKPLKNILISRYKFIPKLSHMAIFGKCASCQK